jgi:OOP family OmpA-OmpF porin
MRLSTLVFSFAFLLVGAGLSVCAAILAVNLIEEITEKDVRRVLSDAGYHWAEIETEGLQVFVIGNAPSEAMRFKAKSAAGTVVDAARVIDQMNVIDSVEVTPPEFKLEILRTGNSVSLMGMLPTRYGVDSLIASINGAVGAEAQVSQLLQTADFPVAENWPMAVRASVEIMSLANIAKLTVTTGEIRGNLVANDYAQGQAFEQQIGMMASDEFTTDITINAPRRVISPFVFSVSKAAKAKEISVCTFQDEATFLEFQSMVANLNFEIKWDCQMGLGRPTAAWKETVFAILGAVDQFQEATATVLGTEVKLLVSKDTDLDLFSRVKSDLSRDLPGEYILQAERPEPNKEVNFAPDFLITLSPERNVQLRGILPTEVAKEMIQSIAEARFGKDNVHLSVRLDDAYEDDRTIHALTAIEAMANLRQGRAILSSSGAEISGQTYDDTLNAKITGLFQDKLSQYQALSLSIDTLEEPRPEKPLGPSAADCIADIGALTSARKINFEPSSDRVDLMAHQVLDDIADVLRECGEIPLEIAGYTDSQGRAEMNLGLSQSRATSILNELQRRRVLTSSYIANGYGEADPIADNDTAEGREENRRIEFRLLDTREHDHPKGTDHE